MFGIYEYIVYMYIGVYNVCRCIHTLYSIYEYVNTSIYEGIYAHIGVYSIYMSIICIILSYHLVRQDTAHAGVCIHIIYR